MSLRRFVRSGSATGLGFRVGLVYVALFALGTARNAPPAFSSLSRIHHAFLSLLLAGDAKHP